MTSAPQKPRPIIMLHDGAIDEFVAEVLLGASADIDLLGVVMVDADCIGRIACNVMWQINAIAGLDIPIGLSSVRALNAFPWPYRSDCIRTSDLATIRSRSLPPWKVVPDGDALLDGLLDAASEPVTILATGPITPLVASLRARPERCKAIAEVVWMAGAIDVQGNLDPTTIPPVLANPYAEWNVFWDPPGSQELLDLYPGPITLVPLDISDKLDIDETLLGPVLEAGRVSAFARFCLEAYGLVSGEPFYRLWDTATAAYVLRPDLFAQPVVTPMKVETDPTADQGALIEDPTGKPLRLVLDFGTHGCAPVIELIADLIVAVG